MVFVLPTIKQLKKKKVLFLAEDAELVFNREDFGILPHHANALFKFYELIRKELLENETKDADIEVWY